MARVCERKGKISGTKEEKEERARGRERENKRPEREERSARDAGPEGSKKKEDGLKRREEDSGSVRRGGEMERKIGTDIETDRGRKRQGWAEGCGGVSHCRIAPSPTRFHLYRFAILRVFCAVALG